MAVPQIGNHTGADGSLTQYDAFSAWLGQPVRRRVTFGAHDPASGWNGIANLSDGTAMKTWLGRTTSNYETYTLALCPDGSASGILAQVASGTYDSYFRTCATSLVSTTYASRILIRLGWELNGTWYSWSAHANGNTVTDYINAYQHIVTVMKAVTGGSALSFEWNISATATPSFDYTTAYSNSTTSLSPYVDVISCDVYDQYNSGNWGNILNGGSGVIAGGLTRFRSFAQSMGKPEAYTEWSTAITTQNGNGDNMNFIQRMFEWFSGGNVLYHSYWNTSSGGPNGAIQGSSAGNMPNAAEYYKLIWGQNNLQTTLINASTDGSGHKYPSLALPDTAVTCFFDGTYFRVNY